MRPALLGNMSPFTRFVFAMLLTFSCFLAIFIAGVLLAIPIFHINLFETLTQLGDFSDPATLALVKYLQVVQSFGLFIIPPLLAGFFFERNSLAYLKLDQPGKPLTYLLVFIMLFAALPLINWMISFNEMLKLPEFLKGVETWMKQSEEAAARLTGAFLNTTTPGGLLFNLFMIALLPALGEEFMFRGLLQRLFAEWFNNMHIAILLSAFLFGAMHMQFYGVLPRICLGLLFGYLFYWTGSLWIPVFGHFINNGSAVVTAYLSKTGVITGDWEKFGSTDNVFVIITSALAVLGLCMIIRKFQKPATGHLLL